MTPSPQEVTQLLVAWVSKWALFFQIQSTAESTYNSLQMSLINRLSKGVQLLASYTYAKSLDNASGISDSTGDSAADTDAIGSNQLDNRANCA